MDYRKIIKFGRSAHVVSLPQQWLVQNQLNKGDTLFIEAIGNQIILTTEKEEKPPETIITITITGQEKNSHIARKLISAYENNATTIIFTGKKLSAYAKVIHELVKFFTALEIIEHTKEKIICKVYINSDEIDIASFSRRIENGVKSIIKDICEKIISLEDMTTFREDIIEREKNVDKITRLLRRVIKERLYKQSQQKEDILTLLRHWQTIVYIEEFCDLFEEITLLSLEKYSLEERTQAKRFLQQTAELFDKTMHLLHTKESEKSHLLTDEIKELKEKTEKELKNKKHTILLHKISQSIYLIRELNKINY